MRTKAKLRKVEDRPPLVMSVPEAGRKYLGLSPAGSYAAAARGELPTLRVGRLLKVPVIRMERLLAGD